MKNYVSIINAYMNFFVCNIYERVDESMTREYFEDIYSYGKQFDKNIEKVIYELHMPDVRVTKEEHIIIVFDAIISELRKCIRNWLKKIDVRERKIVFYLLAAFQTEFHGRIKILSEGRNFDLTQAHPLERDVLELVKNKKYVFEIKEISALDKYTLQMIFQECLMADDIQDSQVDVEVSTEMFVNIYGTALTVMGVMEKRWLLTLGFFNDPVLIIENGKMEFQEGFTYNTESYADKFERDVKQYQKTYPKKIISQLDNNFEKVYGFRVDTVKKLVESEPKLLVSKNLAVEANYISIVGEIVALSNCTIEEAENIFAYMLVDERKRIEKKSETPEKDENRIFEKCILRVGEDRYLYSQVLMGYAYFILLRKLQFNLHAKCESANAQIIHGKIKKKFEEETRICIKKYFPNVLSNVHKLDDGTTLSNEVDIIFAVKGEMYIVECKDVSFRYTPNGFLSDVKKEREFVKKMILKKQSVTENIKYFEERFEQKIKEVKGYLVYRTTNFVTENIKADKNITIVSFEEFKEILSRM